MNAFTHPTRWLHRIPGCPSITDTLNDTTPYTIRVTVLGDPQGATFIASKFVPENQDLGSEADAAVETN